MAYGDTRVGKSDHEIDAWIRGSREGEPRRHAGYIVRRTTQFPLWREDKLKLWKWYQDNNVKEDNE